VKIQTWISQDDTGPPIPRFNSAAHKLLVLYMAHQKMSISYTVLYYAVVPKFFFNAHTRAAMYLHTIKTPAPLSVSQTCQFAERRIEGREISYKKKRKKGQL